MADKTFTVEEANALLPQIEELIVEMLSLREEILSGVAELESTFGHAHANGGSRKASAYLLLIQRFQAADTVLSDLGCELKDLDEGLVDFPSYRDGALVYLCWKRGEPRIEYWHQIDAGFAGRQPL